MLANGDDPSKVTDATFKKAVDTIKKAVDSGQVRQFTGNDYAPLLAKGDVCGVLRVVGRHGAAPGRPPGLKWVLPDSGGMIWTDNMLIPKGGNAYAASVLHELVLPARRSRPRSRTTSTTSARSSAPTRCSEDRPGGREEPADLPDEGDARERAPDRREGASTTRSTRQRFQQPDRRSEPSCSTAERGDRAVRCCSRRAWRGCSSSSSCPMYYLGEDVALEQGLVPALQLQLGVGQLQRRGLRRTRRSSSARSSTRASRRRSRC